VQLLRAPPRARDWAPAVLNCVRRTGAGKLPCVAVGGSSCACVRTHVSDRERVCDALRVCGDRGASQHDLAVSALAEHREELQGQRAREGEAGVGSCGVTSSTERE
jgi:hypothetical protein